MALWLCQSFGPLLWSRLKYLINYLMGCHVAHVPLGIICNHFSDHLTFNLAPLSVKIYILSNTLVYNQMPAKPMTSHQPQLYFDCTKMVNICKHDTCLTSACLHCYREYVSMQTLTFNCCCLSTAS